MRKRVTRIGLSPMSWRSWVVVRVKMSCCVKLMLRVEGDSKAVFEALAEALAYFDRVGGVVAPVWSFEITEDQSAESMSVRSRIGADASVEGSSLAVSSSD